jgi:hypothetical protein
MTEPVIADGIRFADGFVLRTDEMDSPDDGAVLTNPGGSGGGGWIPPAAITENLHIPCAPSFLDYATSTTQSVEGSAATATLTLEWQNPPLNTDGSAVTDLKGFELSIPLLGILQKIPIDVGSSTEWQISGLPLNTTYAVSIVAVDTGDNHSDAIVESVTTASVETVPLATDVHAHNIANGMVDVDCDDITRSDLSGFLLYYRQYMAYSEFAPADDDPGWDAWSGQRFYPCTSGTLPNMVIQLPFVGKWTQFAVEACVYGGYTSASWTMSTPILTTGVVASDFETDALNAEIAQLVGSGAVLLDGSGMVCKNGKFLFYSDDGTDATPDSALRIGIQSGAPQVAAFNAAGKKALLGQSGTFWGLYVEGGAIQVSTASDTDNTTLIDSSGIHGFKGGVEVFDLDNTAGLTLRQSNINLIGGGFIQLGGTEGDADTSTTRLTHEALFVYNSSSQAVVRLGKQADNSFGLLVSGTSNKIIGADIRTSESGARVELIGSNASLDLHTAYTDSWTDAYGNVQNITYVTRASNVSTIEVNALNPGIAIGQTIYVSGCSNTTFNGTWTVTGVGTLSFTFAQTAANVTRVAATGTVESHAHFVSTEYAPANFVPEIVTGTGGYLTIYSPQIDTTKDGAAFFTGTRSYIQLGGSVLNGSGAGASFEAITLCAATGKIVLVGGYGVLGADEAENQTLIFAAGGVEIYPDRMIATGAAFSGDTYLDGNIYFNASNGTSGGTIYMKFIDGNYYSVRASTSGANFYWQAYVGGAWRNPV